MAMTTRCPQCGTAFKVVPDQLRVRNGLVRCGACDTVFDGRACLVAQIPQGGAYPPPTGASQAAAAPPSPMPAGPASSPAPAGTPPAPHPAPGPAVDPALVPIAAPSVPVMWPARAEPSLAADPQPQPRPDPAAASPAVLRGRSDIRRQDPYLDGPSRDDPDEPDDEPLEDDEPDLSPVAVPDTRRAEPGRDTDAAAPPPAPHAEVEPHVEVEPTVLGEARTRYYGATDVGRTPPEFLDTDHQKRRHLVRSLWGYACVIGLLALALQLVFVYRSAIATAAPAMRPLLTSLCEPLGCEVGYARRIERIFITSSSLQPPRGQAGAPDDDRSRLVLRASLRNRYDKPQHWPALLLDLTDISDTVVVRKVLQPADYLPEGRIQGPFEPGAEINIAVPIEVAGAHVNGYQLDKFFP